MAKELAAFLGVFSIGLGLAEMLAPGELGKTFNMDGKEPLLMSFGARELCAGIGILSRLNSADDKLAPWLGFRVAGDALDIASLLAARSDAGERQQNVNTALYAVAGITLLDIVCARSLGK